LRLLARGMVAMEVGAGIGAHAVPIAEALGADGHLFLYEADPFLKQVLHENLRSNRVTNATVMRRALTGSGSSEGCECVDDLRLERLQLLKINESADANSVLYGAQATIARLRPQVFVQIAVDQDVTPIVSALRIQGYTPWRREAPLFNRENFNGRDVDVFGGRTSLALLGISGDSAFDAACDWERLA
jgi:hypothetical protein